MIRGDRKVIGFWRRVAHKASCEEDPVSGYDRFSRLIGKFECSLGLQSFGSRRTDRNTSSYYTLHPRMSKLTRKTSYQRSP